MLDAPLTNALFTHVELAENGVIHCLPSRFNVETRNKRETIAWLQSTPPPTLETLSVKETYSSNGDSGFTEAEEYGV